ncbi:glucosyltransferase domain-containing protein [Bifidobacterium sp. ESL0732]|uniref:glucosyltransferase domain-containing protein n=1 Tax=Bifidobacterium sp. ESL0732 TaxID=2983222 RepID=UPI0023F9F213|nr:glucosyltransferase domain-containing protein [Bifidobacterium sp. ESL0732]WEV64333.1 glucosyltransferase domain-containing protein [Bifidobacterium sp. ESL0732]
MPHTNTTEMKKTTNKLSNAVIGLLHDKTAQIVFTVTFLSGLCAHLYRWTNPMFSHDSSQVVSDDQYYMIAYGRFLQIPLSKMRGYINSPLLLGILGTLYLTFAIICICKILRIKSLLLTGCISGILSTCSVMTLVNATYMNYYDLMMLALLCSCLAAKYICDNSEFTDLLSASVFIVLSMGLYQAYLPVTVALVVGRLLADTLKKINYRLVIKRGIFAILTIFISATIFYAIAEVIIKVVIGKQLKAYNSMSNASLSFKSVKTAYIAPFAYLLDPETHASMLIGVINITLGLLCVAAILLTVHRNALSIVNIFLSCFLILILPLAMNCIGAISGFEHGLMIFSFFLFYPISFMLLELIPKTGIRQSSVLSPGTGTISIIQPLLTTILSIVLIFCNIVYSNQVYVAKGLQEQGTLSIMTRVVSDMESTKGYQAGKTPVVIIGSLDENHAFPNLHKQFVKQPRSQRYAGLYGTGLESNWSVTYPLTYQRYFTYVMGYPVKLVQDKKMLKTARFREAADHLDSFPSPKCTKMVDSYLIVKLSDNKGAHSSQ